MTIYISNFSLNNHQPLQKRISAIDYGTKRIWTVGLEPCDSFIVDSYDFNKYIFFIDYNDIHKIWTVDKNKEVIVIIKNCTDETDALYQLETDLNIHIRCIFSDKLVKDVL